MSSESFLSDIGKELSAVVTQYSARLGYVHGAFLLYGMVSFAVFSLSKTRGDAAATHVRWSSSLLVIALVNFFPWSYDRNENNPFRWLFWVFAAGFFAIAGVNGVVWEKGEGFLSRSQSEEWKGWMQALFLLYHYFRENRVYNGIRVFVSAYVFLTGMGNFAYFSRKGDFSGRRVAMMLLRINLLPACLSLVCGAGLFSDYYIAPLHSYWFLVCYAVCWCAVRMFPMMTQHSAEGVAIFICALFQVLFWEVVVGGGLMSAGVFPEWAQKSVGEISFRFGLERYVGLWGMVFAWGVQPRLQSWSKRSENVRTFSSGRPLNIILSFWFSALSLLIGAALVGVWYVFFGEIGDKFAYNVFHPHVAILPILGYLLVRNSTAFLRSAHFPLFEACGKISLEL